MNQYTFATLSFELRENWNEYRRDNWSITFVDSKDTNSYKANFTIMILDEESSVSMDDIVESNLDQLSEVYVKLNVISYDTNVVNNYKCRKVSFASLTKNKEIIGTVLCLMKNEKSLIMASFQGANKGGVFEKRIKEIEGIINSIKF